MKGATGKAVHTEGGARTRRNTQKAVCGHRRRLVINIQGGGLLVYGGVTTRRGDGLNRTSGHFFGQNKGGVTD